MNETKLDQKILSAISDTSISDRKILNVPISTIIATPYNPSARTKDGAKLNKLINAIKSHGLMYPILITMDRELIDGNRRLKACKALGFETIECVISSVDKDVAFTTINTTSQSLGGKGWLDMAKRGGRLPEPQASQYGKLLSLLGSYGIDLLIKLDIGLAILPLCERAKRIGVKKNLDELILLVAKNRLTNRINMEMRSDRPDEKKAAAINKMLREAVEK